MHHEERPWGSFTVLESDTNFQVKKLFVNPNKRLSLQSHKYRAEHWFVVSGAAIVQIDSTELEMTEGDSVDIPIGSKHRISCISKTPLIFIEVQTGTSFNEEDIARYEDDFGRS